MMMYFEFNEDKLKQNDLTKDQCGTTSRKRTHKIDKF